MKLFEPKVSFQQRQNAQAFVFFQVMKTVSGRKKQNGQKHIWNPFRKRIILMDNKVLHKLWSLTRFFFSC
jgi:hypothetical protein